VILKKKQSIKNSPAKNGEKLNDFCPYLSFFLACVVKIQLNHWGPQRLFRTIAYLLKAFLAAALTRVMHAAVPIPAIAAASVLHSAALGGSVAGDVGAL